MKNKIVSHNAWVEARKLFLAKEKEFTKQRDALSQQRRKLPWEKVNKEYFFEGPNGSKSLSELFDGRSQLIVYHFMYGPNWEAGCPSCSFLTDHFNAAIVHLNQRDVSMAAISNAPITLLEQYKKRMGWSFLWLSSYQNDFNKDYSVSFTQDEIENNEAYYNYEITSFPSTEAPGVSVFFKDADGNLFHTYSSYARGLDMFITTYHYLDLVPKGRDEDKLSFSMEWVRRHDEYSD